MASSAYGGFGTLRWTRRWPRPGAEFSRHGNASKSACNGWGATIILLHSAMQERRNLRRLAVSSVRRATSIRPRDTSQRQQRVREPRHTWFRRQSLVDNSRIASPVLSVAFEAYFATRCLAFASMRPSLKGFAAVMAVPTSLSSSLLPARSNQNAAAAQQLFRRNAVIGLLTNLDDLILGEPDLTHRGFSGLGLPEECRSWWTGLRGVPPDRRGLWCQNETNPDRG